MVGGAEALMCSVVPCTVCLGQEAFGAGAGAFVGVECSWLVGFVVSLGAEGVVGPVGLWGYVDGGGVWVLEFTE